MRINSAIRGNGARAIVETELAESVEAVAVTRDRAAFTRLFDHFAPRIKSYILHLGSDPASAEECVQEVMLAVWRHAASFDRRRASPSTWIFTIARNRRIDLARRLHRPGIDLADPMLDSFSENASTWPTVEEECAMAEQQNLLIKALAELPPDRSELVRMAFIGGKSHHSIAAELGLPLGTVKSRIYRTLAELRKTLSDSE